MRSRFARSSSWSSGCSARCFSAAASRRAVVSWPAANKNVGGPHDVDDLGRGPVGVGREREVREHVVARLAPPVLDVLREPVVEPPERVELHVALLAHADLAGVAAQAEVFAEPPVILFRHAEQVGDHEHRERLRVRADELAAAVGDELAELLIGEAPHELLVVLEPLRRDQPHQERAFLRVRGRIHGDHVLVHRQLVAVAIDDVAHVVALERHRERGERTDHRVARRERVDVAVDLGRLVVAGHRHHPVMGERLHRAGRAQLLEVGIRVLDERLVHEEVDRRPSRRSRRAPPRPRFVHSHNMLCNCLTPGRPRMARCGRWIAAGAPDRRQGLAHPRPAARRRRAADARGGLRRRHVAPGRAQGRPQLAARPLLLPHDGRPLPRGVPPPRRGGLRAVRAGHRGPALAAHDLEAR